MIGMHACRDPDRLRDSSLAMALVVETRITAADVTFNEHNEVWSLSRSIETTFSCQHEDDIKGET